MGSFDYNENIQIIYLSVYYHKYGAVVQKWAWCNLKTRWNVPTDLPLHLWELSHEKYDQKM